MFLRFNHRFFIAFVISFAFLFNVPVTNSKVKPKQKVTKKIAAKKVLKPAIVAPKPIKKDTIFSINELHNEITNLIVTTGLQQSNFGIAIYSHKDKKMVYSHNPRLALTPASVTKLFTTFAAMNIMGTNPAVKTTVYTDAKKITPELNGNIYIYGRGDAFLSINDIEQIAEKIKNLGIKKINGNVYADNSFFDKETNRFRYSGDMDEVENVRPIMPFSLNDNTVTLVASSGLTPGKPVNLQTIPSSSAFIKNVTAKVGSLARPKKVKAKSGKSRAELNYDSEENNFVYNSMLQQFGDANDFAARARIKAPAAPSSPVSFATSVSPDGKQVFTVSGALSPNRTISKTFQITNPDLAVAGALFDRLKALGIQITGSFARKQYGDIAHAKPVVEFQRPLNSIMTTLNKNSDNYLAEHIFKMVGAYAGNHTNNRDGATKYYKRLFDSLKLHYPECVFNDGSGLSRRNKTSAEAIIGVLNTIHNSSYYDYYKNTLPIAGVDGTLRRRFWGTPAYGNLCAKTGTHGNVSALAGYVRSLSGEEYSFAFIFNGNSLGLYKQAENKIGELISKLYIK